MFRNSVSPTVFPFSWASDWGEDRYGVWIALTIQDVRQVFRWIPPGKFMMGSPQDEAGRYHDETLHKVTISRGFWLGNTAVTQALWQVVMSDNPSEFKEPQRPVETVSWDDCQDFIKRLNQYYPQLDARLPWEAEWEYACRAGTTGSFHFNGELSLDNVNYNGSWGQLEFSGDAKQETVAVKQYPCNPWGLFDMHGNVWEGCEDAWQEDLGNKACVDPWEMNSDAGVPRVVRGGSWVNGGRGVRSAVRDGSGPGGRDYSLGFRLALGH